MTDHPGCFSESLHKGHQQDFGQNQLGIIVSPFQQTCKRCYKTVFVGQRVMKDPDAKSWPHLECANPEWFSRVDDDSCTEPAIARPDVDKRKFCAWCTEEIIADDDKWKACWMGWVHADCDPGRKSDFVKIVRRLQQRHSGGSMPHQCHEWETLEELETHALLGHYTEQPVYEATDSNWTQQARADQRNRALATRDSVSAFSSHGISRRLLYGDAPDAASDAPSAHDDSSDSDSSAHSLPASDVDSDDELLETRGFRLFRLRISEQSHRRAGKYPRRRIRRQGPQRRLIHPGTEGNELDKEIMLPCSRSHRARPNTGRTEALGDEDTSSGGDESDISDSFIVPDSSSNDGDSDNYSAVTGSESNASGSGGRDGADSAPDQNMQQPQSDTTIVPSVDASADDDGADCESVRSAGSDVQVNSARRCRRKAVLPLGVIDLTKLDDEAQPTGPPTPAQTAQKLAGCKRLCKKV